MTVFLAGDVMTGRGIDQILPTPVRPVLHESYVKDARAYVTLAEQESGAIPRGAPFEYVWGDASDELAQVGPDVRIVNLETAVTTSDEWWRGKGIHYRMHPENVRVLTALGVDVCILANNHVMDWGRDGLTETIRVLRAAGMRTAGAGVDALAASDPAVLETAGGRLLVFAYASEDSGVPSDWTAGDGRPGVNLLRESGGHGALRVIDEVRARRRPGDRVIVSVHWGGNWGYGVHRSQREFAHRLIDAGVADIIHGHSSHHPKGIEVYGGRLVLYGAGDFINDYEGIGGRDEYRGDLSLMYFASLDPSGILVALEMAPLRIRRFRLEAARAPDADWLARTLDRESQPLGSAVHIKTGGRLTLRVTD